MQMLLSPIKWCCRAYRQVDKLETYAGIKTQKEYKNLNQENVEILNPLLKQRMHAIKEYEDQHSWWNVAFVTKMIFGYF